ncbi:MAG: glycoside hydrolase family 78 protein [Clostridiales bacterium]|nr:glycoside hydrolase family 78 protein [Clostridiales bacterium]
MKIRISYCCIAAILALCSCDDNVTTTVGQRVEPLADSLWEKSCWISVADAPVVRERIYDGARAADGAAWFVTEVTNRKKVTQARWMTTSLGVNDLYVNGQPVGEEILKPGFTHPLKTRLSYTYDITSGMDCAAGGTNTLAVQVTPGWWADKIVTPGHSDGMIGHKVAFRGVLELTHDDGSKSYVASDTITWKAGIAGPVKHAAIFDGEVYDSRELPGYMTPEKLSTPAVNDEFKGEIYPCEGAEVYFRDDLALSPVNAYNWSEVTGADEENHGTVVVNRRYSPGETMTVKAGEKLVVDFGQNCAGVPDFEFIAQPGTTLRFLPGELLNDGNGAHSRGMDGPEGSVHRLNLRCPDSGMSLDYTFGGDGNQYSTFRPRNTFFGYRYATIEADADVEIKSVKTIPVTSISDTLELGTLSTGNASINQLISNTVWGMRSNYLSVPTDCPQRNERLGWTADTQVFSETGTYFANTRDFFHKWLRDMRDTQTPTGGLPGVAPWAQYGAYDNDMMRLGWADAGIIVPWVIWKQYGDTGIIDENWEMMERYINHLADVKASHEALTAENNNYQWADWLSYEPLESCGGGIYDTNSKGEVFLRPEAVDYWNYLASNYWLMDAEMMADMARASGRDPEPYSAMAQEARQQLVEKHLDADGLFVNAILNTMQTPALFALKNNLVEGDAREKMIERLRQNIADHDNCLQTGFLGTSILMPTLTENGMTDIAYELLFQRRNPSWLYSIDNGATTIWERWNSYMLDKGMGPRGMNSFNHYAYGCVCEWLWETAAGISADPSDPGFKTIIMQPRPDRRLGHLDATYNSQAGEIKSSWRYEGDNWLWDITVPSGARAMVTLPGENTPTEYSAGQHHFSLML